MCVCVAVSGSGAGLQPLLQLALAILDHVKSIRLSKEVRGLLTTRCYECLPPPPTTGEGEGQQEQSKGGTDAGQAAALPATGGKRGGVCLSVW